MLEINRHHRNHPEDQQGLLNGIGATVNLLPTVPDDEQEGREGDEITTRSCNKKKQQETSWWWQQQQQQQPPRSKMTLTRRATTTTTTTTTESRSQHSPCSSSPDASNASQSSQQPSSSSPERTYQNRMVFFLILLCLMAIYQGQDQFESIGSMMELSSALASSSTSRSSSAKEKSKKGATGVAATVSPMQEMLQDRLERRQRQAQKELNKLPSNLNHTEYGYASLQELLERPKRFPSLQARVQHYMGDWYFPPCPGNDQAVITYQFRKEEDMLAKEPIVDDFYMAQERFWVENTNSDETTSTTTSSIQPLDGLDDMWIREIPSYDPFPTTWLRRRKYPQSLSQQRVIRLSSESNMMNMAHYLNPDMPCQAASAYCDSTDEFLVPAFRRYEQSVQEETRRVMQSLSKNLTSSLSSSLDNNNNNNNNNNNLQEELSRTCPLILQYGDSERVAADTGRRRQENLFFPNFPVFKKFRLMFQSDREHPLFYDDVPPHACLEGLRIPRPTTTHSIYEYEWQIPFQPIVVKQKAKRHFGMLPTIAGADVPWDKKQNRAVFRGAVTGLDFGGTNTSWHLQRYPELVLERPPKELCSTIPRCKLVYEYNNSTAVDAKFVEEGKTHVVPADIDGRPMYATDRMSYHDLLQYKALLMLEGHDVSTGLKWALLSQSVVVMPVPTKTSWAMEELLEPWVHYVPLLDDLSDVEEKVQWIVDHDREAQDIAHRASLWIKDLFFHPLVEREEELIYDEIIRRYQLHFQYDPDLDWDPYWSAEF